MDLSVGCGGMVIVWKKDFLCRCIIVQPLVQNMIHFNGVPHGVHSFCLQIVSCTCNITASLVFGDIVKIIMTLKEVYISSNSWYLR